MKPIYRLLVVFSFLLPTLLKAQNPGSISGYKLWLEASKVNDTLSKQKIKNEKAVSFTHFNFNPVLDLQSQKKNIFRNIIDRQYSLFTVFKSDFEEERNVLTVTRGSRKVYITNKALLSDKDMLYKKVNSRQGIILSYINGNNDKNGKKRNSLEIDDLFGEDKEGNEQLLELLYFPKLLDDNERNKVETYLSLKYGISILGDFDYIDSGNVKIWDSKENKAYNNRVTGIGRDIAFNLLQKQSGNSQKDGLYIGLGKVDTTNTANDYKIADRTFLLWGDNAGKTFLVKDKKDGYLKKMERSWKMQLTGTKQHVNITTQLKINKKELSYVNDVTEGEFLWIAINEVVNPIFDYTVARYYKQSSEDDEYIYFNDIEWDKDKSGNDIFTFIKGPDFFIEHKENIACSGEAGKIEVKMGGGTPPYNITLESSAKNEKIITNHDHYEFADLPGGKYSLAVTDSKNKTKDQDIEIDAFTTGFSLLPLWYLNESGEVVVSATISKSNTEDLSLEWKKNNIIVSTDKQFIAKETGEYSLIAKTSSGCSKEIPFKVESHSGITQSGWKVYPNPTKKAEPFTILFSLERESEVMLSINSMEGKDVIHKNLGRIKNFEYRDAISTAGVYLVTVTINNNSSETVKLIIH